MKTAVLELSTGREIVQNAELRAGPFTDSSVFDHSCDAACLVIRKMLGIKSEDRWVLFTDTKNYTALRECLHEYALFELAGSKL